MAESFFNVEDFIQSILVQLDRVQDALRMKAVNRPLTYALKDFSLDFHVFAQVDASGVVRFRPAAANEAGSSTLRLGFTTITKPMIEENTVSMAATRGPTLEEAGLAPTEARRLEGLGVRTTDQLDRLQRAAGQTTVSRWSGIPQARLSDALLQGRPSVSHIRVRPAAPPISAPVPAPAPAPPGPITSPVVHGPGAIVGSGPVRYPGIPPKLGPGGIPRQVTIGGRNFPDVLRAKYADQPLEIAQAADDRIVVNVPPTAPSEGTLELTFANDDVHAFDVRLQDPDGDGAEDLWNGGAR